jgi:spore germination cell wall hydrolase CwlJ-like protein
MKYKLFILGIFLSGGVAPAKAEDINCLAKNIYYEARGVSIQKQKAVAKVTMNRVRSNSYPNDICSVVYQKSQFSWTANSNAKRGLREPKAWARSYALAYKIVYKGIDPYPGLSAKWFHDTSIRKPYWAKSLQVELRVPPFIFYKEKMK